MTIGGNAISSRGNALRPKYCGLVSQCVCFDCFVAMLSPSCSQCWPLVILIIAIVPFVGWLVLPLLGRRRYVLDHLAHPRWWTPKAVTSLGRVTYWIDILCKNQFIVNSEDTAEELSKCVRDCGQTALACIPWEKPECLKRVWCQFEIHHTYLAKKNLKACYSENEKIKIKSWSSCRPRTFRNLCNVRDRD